MKLDRSTLDLISYREQKQLQGEKHVLKLYVWAKEYTERHANIREMVRAKYIFRKMLGLKEDAPFTEIQNRIFSEWFLFDYKTIQGNTMFNQFLKNNHSQLTHYELTYGALFLTSVFEPVKIHNIDGTNNLIWVSGMENDHAFSIRSFNNTFDLCTDRFYFIRKLPLINHNVGLGPVFSIDHSALVEKMQKEYSQLKGKQPTLTWRAFLKVNAILFLRG